jgi:hypothetical protein
MDERGQASLFVRHGAKEIIVERARCYAFYSGIGVAGGWFGSAAARDGSGSRNGPRPHVVPRFAKNAEAANDASD